MMIDSSAPQHAFRLAKRHAFHFLSLLEIIFYPAFFLGILWSLLLGYQPVFVFPLFGILITLLYLRSDVMLSFWGLCLTSLVGILGGLFSLSVEAKMIYGLNLLLVWVLFYVLTRMDKYHHGKINKLQEGYDRLELEIARLASDSLAMEEDIVNAKERITAYGRLQSFTDDLIGATNREGLVQNARKGLEILFSRAEVTVALFPEPDKPAPGDAIGARMMRNPYPLLFPFKNASVYSKTTGTFIMAPLRVKNRISGWISLEAKKDARPFGISYLRLIAIITDIFSLALGNADLYKEVEALAVTDSLTGLNTRAYFNERLKEEAARAHFKSAPLSLIILDLDHFKDVNDTYGHPLGDEILRWVAQVLGALARETDFIARYGGEEFIVLMPNAKLPDAMGLANRLREYIRGTSFRWENKKIQLTISLGVASMNPDSSSEIDLLRRADQALYRAKKNGRDRVENL